ncbi:hypothetical protein, partial [Streptomyces sp. IBSBF 2435]|uniref:hypothetical protein n=1 Tax=Streptomyces sp. IBSBF 2435 TaxID=2903531 RepID=UPI002FDC07EA
MFKGIRSLLPPGRPLQCRAAGDALLIQPKGRTDQAAWRFARALARDEQHTVVVVDVPGVAPDTAADALAHALADTEGSLRLVFGGGTSAEIRAAGQRIAEALGTVVVVPDGEVLPTAGGGLYIPGGHGSGWLRLRPGRPSEHDSMGFPKPRWQFSMMDRPWAASPYAVVEPLPCGVWVRGALPESADDNRRWLFGSLAADPDVMTVVLGCPGGPAVPLADVVRFWGTVMPSARSRIRFVHFGPVVLSQEGEALGQQLADALEHQVVLYTGMSMSMSMSEDGRAEGDGATAVPSGVLPSGAAPDGADRTAGRAGFVRELRYSPRGTEDAPPPALAGVREPLPGFRPVAPGVYEYAFDAVLEVVQSGLWMRPQTEPADGDDVRRIPAAPGERLFLYHRGSPDVAARMQALAEDALWRLGADARGEFALRPADDPAVDTGVWYAEPVAVPDPHEAVTAAIPPMTRPAGIAPWAPAPAAEDVPAPESAAPAAPARSAPAAAATPFQAEAWASAADDLSAPARRAAAAPPPSLRPLSGLTAGPAPALPDGWAPSCPTESVMPQAPAAVSGPFVAAGPAAGAVGVPESRPVEGSAAGASGAASGAPGSPAAEGSAAVGGPFVAAGPAAGAAWSSPSSPPRRPAPAAATGPEGAGPSHNSGTPSGGSDASVSPRSADDAGAASEGTEDAGSAAPVAPVSGAGGAGSGWLRSAVRAVGGLTFAGSPRAAGADAAPEEPVAAGPTARAGAAPGADGDAEPTAAEAAPGPPSTDSGLAPVGLPALRPLPLAHPTAIFPPSNSVPSPVAPTGPTAVSPTAAGPVSSPEPPTTQPPAPLPPEPSASPAPASVPLSVAPIAATPRPSVSPSASPAAAAPPVPVSPAFAPPSPVTPAAAVPPVPVPPAAATPPASVSSSVSPAAATPRPSVPPSASPA